MSFLVMLALTLWILCEGSKALIKSVD